MALSSARVLPREVDTDTLDTVLAHHCARSSLCLLIESRPRTPQHRSTSAVAQQRRSEWTCHSGLMWLNNPAHFDPAQRRLGCCASAGPDREALAVGVCRVGVCCSGPGWVQCGEMPNPPMPAGLGCSAAQGSVFGGSPPSPIAARIPGRDVQQRRRTCSGQVRAIGIPGRGAVETFGSAGVRVRRIAGIARRCEDSRLVCSAAEGSVFGTGPRYRNPRSGRR